MRVFAVSDLHVEYEDNAQWLSAVSETDYTDDLLILAGDVSRSLRLLAWCFGLLRRRFHDVVYVPGNHELWTAGESPGGTSFDKFSRVSALAVGHGIAVETLTRNGVTIVPLLGWYDYSFGRPDTELCRRWADFTACVWPPACTERDVTQFFLERNVLARPSASDVVLSCSHFVPRSDVIPAPALSRYTFLRPVLGTTRLDDQLRAVGSTLHVYGHSHVNRRVYLDGVTYVNNALGYPHETGTTGRRLVCVHGG